MNNLQILLMSIGLSMDAMAVAICKGLKMHKLHIGYTLTISLSFGGFQALMPFIGWLIGSQFERYIINIDHWIAFILLLIIGGKMILEAFDKDGDETLSTDTNFRYNLKEITLLAIATSIDALAVGITFAFLNVAIGSSILIIGITTFILSVLGVLIGHHFGIKYKSKAEIVGGVILILIGFKILLEHLGLL